MRFHAFSGLNSSPFFSHGALSASSLAESGSVPFVMAASSDSFVWFSNVLSSLMVILSVMCVLWRAQDSNLRGVMRPIYSRARSTAPATRR